MSKLKWVLGETLFFIKVIFVSLFIAIGEIIYFLFLPLDLIYYFTSPYYRDTKQKYRLHLTGSPSIKLYNQIKANKIALKYVKNQDIEYLTSNKLVLLLNWDWIDFNFDDQWYFDMADGKDLSYMPIAQFIKQACEFIDIQDIQKEIKILILSENIADKNKFEKAKGCPYFYCISSIQQLKRLSN